MLEKLTIKDIEKEKLGTLKTFDRSSSLRIDSQSRGSLYRNIHIQEKHQTYGAVTIDSGPEKCCDEKSKSSLLQYIKDGLKKSFKYSIMYHIGVIKENISETEPGNDSTRRKQEYKTKYSKKDKVKGRSKPY